MPNSEPKVSIDASVSQALSLHQAGRINEAESLYRSILRLDKNRFEALHFLGLIHAQRGDYTEADRLISLSLKVNKKTADAFANHARVLNALRRFEQAVVACDRALALNNRHLAAHVSRGIALQDLGQPAAALKSYDQALAIRPDYGIALNNRGTVLLAMGRHDEALANYDRAVKINPNDTAALSGRGKALAVLNRIDEALASCDKAVAIDPRHVPALTYRAILLNLLNRAEEALASADRVIAIEPGCIEAFFHRGNALYGLKRHQEGLASYERALAINPDYVEAVSNRGDVLVRLGEFKAAQESYERAIGLDPKHVPAWRNFGNMLIGLGKNQEAAECYRKALELDPAQKYARGYLILSQLQICDWNNLDEECARLLSEIRKGQCSSTPWNLCFIPSTPADQLLGARLFLREVVGPSPSADHRRHSRDGKLKIGYISPDYRQHPVAQTFVEVLERHDRSQFEVIGISLAAGDGSDIRRRVIQAFDQFHDVHERSDPEIAKLISDLGIHIAVELAPHTEGTRAGILASHPAPIQVNYISASTSGADYLDYILADRHCVPFDQQPFFSEKIVHLPDSFFQRDTTQQAASHVPSRIEAGLPENSFVFCCFNVAYKINPRIFDVWMRILHRVDGSVLWLSQLNEVAVTKLKREAIVRGVDPGRLIFAPRVPLMEDHLARLKLAGLFLDTLPYNAHTTAGDALWAGVPVLTCQGTTFASRIASSVLHAVGLPDLVTTSLEDYEATAVGLAVDRELLASIHRRLEHNRLTHPLFDTGRLCRHIESAYLTMWERWKQGAPPEGFSVAPLEGRACRDH